MQIPKELQDMLSAVEDQERNLRVRELKAYEFFITTPKLSIGIGGHCTACSVDIDFLSHKLIVSSNFPEDYSDGGVKNYTFKNLPIDIFDSILTVIRKTIIKDLEKKGFKVRAAIKALGEV
jgi:hypothetical protein